MESPDLRKKLRDLPRKPGVYLMKDSAGKIIYIGKAKVLSNRVRSYFASKVSPDPKVAALREKIADLELLVTDNEVEALILEANLIKKHKPRYNIDLKDDKRYPYLKLTHDDDYPRLIVTRRLRRDKGLYFGPYTNTKAMRQTQRMLVKLFTLRTCGYKIPHPQRRKYKVCLQYHIKHCPGPCEDLISPAEYDKEVKRVVKFLQGKSKALLEELTTEMKQHAATQEYEEAARVRDQIKAIEAVMQKQKVTADQAVDQDIIALARSGGDLAAVVLQIREGLLIGRQHHYLKASKEELESSIAASFLKQYYLDTTFIPAEIYCSVKADDKTLISKWLSGSRGARVKLLFPQRGEKLRLVEMAEVNARLLLGELLTQKREKEEKLPYVVEMLQKDLYLQTAPVTICAFDISNLGASDAVGSMICFRKGKPAKKHYRHFQIRTVAGQDDYAMMAEVISRYFTRVLAGEEEMPDLCLIDGGRGQLNAALASLDELGIDSLAVCGLAKRLEEIVLPDQEKYLTLPKTSSSLKILQRIRDEAHRFAISYHRKLRDRKTSKSILDDIAGVGPKRKEKLLKEFGSVDAIRKASIDDIQEVIKNQSLAKAIHKYFKQTS